MKVTNYSKVREGGQEEVRGRVGRRGGWRGGWVRWEEGREGE